MFKIICFLNADCAYDKKELKKLYGDEVYFIGDGIGAPKHKELKIPLELYDQIDANTQFIFTSHGDDSPVQREASATNIVQTAACSYHVTEEVAAYGFDAGSGVFSGRFADRSMKIIIAKGAQVTITNQGIDFTLNTNGNFIDSNAQIADTAYQTVMDKNKHVSASEIYNALLSSMQDLYRSKQFPDGPVLHMFSCFVGLGVEGLLESFKHYNLPNTTCYIHGGDKSVKQGMIGSSFEYIQEADLSTVQGKLSFMQQLVIKRPSDMLMIQRMPDGKPKLVKSYLQKNMSEFDLAIHIRDLEAQLEEIATAYGHRISRTDVSTLNAKEFLVEFAKNYTFDSLDEFHHMACFIQILQLKGVLTQQDCYQMLETQLAFSRVNKIFSSLDFLNTLKAVGFNKELLQELLVKSANQTVTNTLSKEAIAINKTMLDELFNSEFVIDKGAIKEQLAKTIAGGSSSFQRKLVKSVCVDGDEEKAIEFDLNFIKQSFIYGNSTNSLVEDVKSIQSEYSVDGFHNFLSRMVCSLVETACTSEYEARAIKFSTLGYCWKVDKI